MHPDKIRSVFALSSQDRYGYFIRQVADSEMVWVIKDGQKYPTVGNNDEQIIIPVFPELDFASFFVKDDWKNYTVDKIEVHDFIELLDDLQEQNIAVAGFPNKDFNSVVVTADEMKSHLLHELQQYE